MATRIDHVGEYHRRSTEDVIFELDTLIHGDVVLDLAVVADPRAIHDDHVLAETAARPDDGTRHHMAEVPDLRPITDCGALVDIRGLVHERALRNAHLYNGIRGDLAL